MNSTNGVADSTAEDMLAVLKGELAMETANQVNEAALIKQQEMEFQEDLKKLWSYHLSHVFLLLLICTLLLLLICTLTHVMP